MSDKPSDTKLWVPGQKLPDRVKNIAIALFTEVCKANLARSTPFRGEANTEAEYRTCISVARMIHRVEQEDIKDDTVGPPKAD